MNKLTHLDDNGKPTMVDISDKDISKRTAIASGKVILPLEVASLFNDKGELVSKKGPVIQTAIIAGVMGAKKTDELIPFCHNLNLQKVDLDIELANEEVLVRAVVKTEGQTGVEMEALTAVSIACLTIYDMCKALSKDIRIDAIELNSKSGGKSGDYVKA